MLVKIFDPVAAPGTPQITSLMPVSNIISRLIEYGCPDLTNKLDLSRCTSQSVAGGGYSNIYKGVLNDNTQVAIKRPRAQIPGYSPASDDRDKTFKQAARELFAWSRFNHRNIAQLLGVAVFLDQICMVSLWVKPGNFYDYINMIEEHNKRLDYADPTKKVDHLDLCIQAAEGLAYLHGEGVIYGDLKAQNLLVDVDGALKITDFGLSILSEFSLRFSSSQNHCGGTNRWMAPELLQELSPRSLEADIYAFGMTVVEILTETIPFPEKKDVILIQAVINKNLTPSRPTRLSADKRRDNEWWNMLQQCWIRDRTKRPSIEGILKVMRITADEWCQIPELPIHDYSIMNTGTSYVDGPEISALSKRYNTTSLCPKNRSSSRTFGLTIGVNVKGIVRHAETDADKIDGFIRQCFQAEESSIISLRGPHATAPDIFSAFERIKSNVDIRKGDRFVFYFNGTSTFEGLCHQLVFWTWGTPFHYDTGGLYITETSIAVFLEELAVEKGCVVLAIFDCDLGHEAEDLMSSGVLENTEAKQVLFRDLSPYTTLSACELGRLVLEDSEGGCFTTALLKAAQLVNLALVTYEDLVSESARYLWTPKPVCYGAFKTQLIFNSLHLPMIPVIFHDTGSGIWILQAGSEAGVILGSVWELFAITSNGSSASLGQVYAKAPGSSATQLKPQNQAVLQSSIQSVLAHSSSVQLRACPLETTIINPLLVYFEPGPWQFNTVLATPTTSCSHTDEAPAYTVLSEGENADVVLKHVAYSLDSDLEHMPMPGSWDTSGLQFEAQIRFREELVDEHNDGRSAMPVSIPANLIDGTLSAIAWWHWHLKRTDVSAPLQATITLEFSKIGEMWRNSLLRCGGEAIQPGAGGVVRLSPQPSDRYGIQVANDSDVSLYAWAFHFSASDFSITKLLGPRDSSPNVPQKSFVTIGDLGNGEPRIGFVFGKRHSVEIGFIKVFWSTTFIDLSDVEQASVSEGVVNFAPRKTFIDKQPYGIGAWGTLILPIVHRNC